MTNIIETSSPIFVVGTPRSGTTLTAKILGRHSRILMPGEVHFFDDIYSRRHELGFPPNGESNDRIFERLATLYGRYNEPDDQERIEKIFSDPSLVEALINKWQSYQDVLSSFMELQAEKAGKARWGNNAPRDIFNIREILSFFPAAKVVVCVRDVRDFLLSYSGKANVSPPVHKARLKKLYHPILTSLLWKSSMRQLLLLEKLVPKDNLIVVRYEDLVLNPEQEIRKICGVIGEEFEGRMLEVQTHNSSFDIPSAGIFSSSVGRWREKLGVEEACWAQVIAGYQLKALGYTLEQLKPNPWKMLWWASSFPISSIRAVNANKHHRGPLVPYLLKRTLSFLAG